jgi:hypothetical protein
LRKDCQQAFGVSDSEDSMEEMSKDLYTTGVDTQEAVDYTSARVEESPEQPNTSFVGKLKQYCPSLYFSLSAWERDHLDSTFFRI